MQPPVGSKTTREPVAAPDLPSGSDATVDAIIGILPQYRVGSSRGMLFALDELVAHCQSDPSRRQRIVARLAECLRPGNTLSVVAREYVCAQLGKIGSAESVDALAGWLADPDVGECARAALTAIPDDAALAALRQAAEAASGPRRPGLFQSLGARRDVRSVGLLARALGDADPAVAGAAAWALGEIGNAAAGRALQKVADKVPATVRPALADAAVRCVERLTASGRGRDAAALRSAIEAVQPARHVPEALARAIAGG